MARDLVVIGGSLAQKPGYAGHTWALLQYALGFRAIGWDVLFLDQLHTSLARDSSGRPSAVADSANAQYVFGVLERVGLERAYSLIVDDGTTWLGVPRSHVLEALSRSALLLNVMGFIRHPEVMAAAGQRVFLDIDPGFGQMWTALGLSDPFAGHDAHVTIGERIGQPDCEIPVCGIEWVTTPQPIVLDEWPVVNGAATRWTTIASWRGAYGPVEYRGKTYGLRVHEFRKFMDLPRRTGQSFEIALDIHPSEVRDLEALAQGGWTLANPSVAAADPDGYRTYVQASLGEFMVAKNMYVATRSGWLSDRSLCYLASGRPVLAQDTGWTTLYPRGLGLVPFQTLDDAQAGVAAVTADYQRHARAARALAEEYFDARKVLPRLLARLGVA